jgi:hypothetical protein
LSEHEGKVSGREGERGVIFFSPPLVRGAGLGTRGGSCHGEAIKWTGPRRGRRSPLREGAWAR